MFDNLRKKIEYKFDVTRLSRSASVKNPLISLIACSALLAFLMEFATCSYRYNFVSKTTPSTFMVLLEVIVFPLSSILIGNVSLLEKIHNYVLVSLTFNPESLNGMLRHSLATLEGE